MRRLVVFTLLAALAACKDEPSFDERYDKAEKQIRAKAKEIDRELQRRPANDEPSPS